MKKFFGTDGIRGIANKDLTPELALRVGRATAEIVGKAHPPKILLGKDPRLSSGMFEGALIAGIVSTGGEVYQCGILPTPGISFLTKLEKADAGIMISASHNPLEHNGIKIFGKDGLKLSDEEENKIEILLHEAQDTLQRPTGKQIGKVHSLPASREKYLSFLRKNFPYKLTHLHIVLDCAYGATSMIAPELFQSLSAKITLLCSEPNGEKINVNCGTTHLSALKQKVLGENADLGIAFDGDGDRTLLVDSRGNEFNGDGILAALAFHWQKKGTLRPPVVSTVMANYGLEEALLAKKIPLLRTAVGDRYVLEEMLKHHANLGGEQSGHIILPDYSSTGDGCLTALHVLSILVETQKPLAELGTLVKKFPQLLVNVPVQNKNALQEDQEIQRSIREVESKLKGRGRILVRPSGTEPLVRVMAEGPDAKELEEVVGQVAKTIEMRLK